MLALGLTGSIGQGKSTVSCFFQRQSVPVLDADAIVHKLYEKGGAAVGPVASVFPSALVDGAISRPALSKCVIGNEEAMKQLESVVHPLVEKERNEWLHKVLAEGNKLVVLDIPLLFEKGNEGLVDAVAVVSAPPEIQRARVLARPGMTVEKFEAILARQMPDEEKRKRADFIIDTSTTLEETEEQVVRLTQTLRERGQEMLAAHSFKKCSS